MDVPDREEGDVLIRILQKILTGRNADRDLRRRPAGAGRTPAPARARVPGRARQRPDRGALPAHRLGRRRRASSASRRSPGSTTRSSGPIPPTSSSTIAEETDLILSARHRVLADRAPGRGLARRPIPRRATSTSRSTSRPASCTTRDAREPGRDGAAHDRTRPRRAVARDHRERADGRRRDRGAHLRASCARSACTSSSTTSAPATRRSRTSRLPGRAC